MLKSKSPFAQLGAALTSLDFSAENAETERLTADLKKTRDKGNDVRAELTSLAEQIANYAPDPEAIAKAILEGATPSEAASAATSKEELISRRSALNSTIPTLEERVKDLRIQIEQVEEQARRKILDAAQPFIDGLAKEQEAAAKAIVERDASIQAIRSLCRFHMPAATESQSLRRGVTGGDSPIGRLSTIEVPGELIAALEPLKANCLAAKAGVTGLIANN